MQLLSAVHSNKDNSIRLLLLPLLVVVDVAEGHGNARRIWANNMSSGPCCCYICFVGEDIIVCHVFRGRLSSSIHAKLLNCVSVRRREGGVDGYGGWWPAMEGH